MEPVHRRKCGNSFSQGPNCNKIVSIYKDTGRADLRKVFAGDVEERNYSMSEQQFQREQLDQEPHQHEDPLAELARIVAGEDNVSAPTPPASQVEQAKAPAKETMAGAPQANIAPVTPVDVASQNDGRAQESGTAPQASANASTQPVSNPASTIAAQNQDLESQLLAELGGEEPVVPSRQSPAPDRGTSDEAQLTAAASAQVEPAPSAGEEDFELALAQQLIQVAPSGSPVAEAAPAIAEVAPENPQHPVSPPVEVTAAGGGAGELAALDNVALDNDTLDNGVPVVDEMDFSAAFDAELNQASVANDISAPAGQPMGTEKGNGLFEPQAQPDVVQAQEFVSEPQPAETGFNENAVATPVQNAASVAVPDQFQFQAAPDYQQHDQQINQSVQAIQEDIVDSLEIEDAFSDAFAEELSTQMGQDKPDAEVVSAGTHPSMDGHATAMASQQSATQTGVAETQTPQLPLQNQQPAPGVASVEEQPPVLIAPPRRPVRRIAAAALGLAVLAGSGVVAYSYISSDTTDSEPVVVRADTREFKVKPEKPGGKEIANQDQPVYDEVAGKNTDTKAQGMLVQTGEEPVDIASNVEPVKPVKSNVRLATQNNTPNVENGVAVMQPRKVKTVAVRADGSLVTALADPVANLPSSVRTALDAQSGNASSADNSIDGASSTGDIAVPSANPNAQGGNVKTAVVQPAVVKPRVVQTRALAVPTTATPEAVSQPVPVSTRAENAQPAGDGYVVQVSSQRSFEAAEATYQNLKRRFASLLSGQEKEIREATVEGKGTFFRVRILQNSKAEALDFCTRYKSAGGSCFVTR